MKNFNHQDQQSIWDAEHARPNVLVQMDSEEASSGVVKFLKFLEGENVRDIKGVEMGCGKGRNVIWLAQRVSVMYGFDFSPTAIEEAKRRAQKQKVENAYFDVQDATVTWKYDSNYFDIAIDCFALTDIESSEGRICAIKEFWRVLKSGGYLFAYLLSTDDEFHKEMIQKTPAKEKGAFHHSTGKFEKVVGGSTNSKSYTRILIWSHGSESGKQLNFLVRIMPVNISG